ncbi:MAG: hypothetical protein ACYCZF_00625 [Anaerolineae bacterium]
MPATRWEYRVCTCQFEITSEGGIFREDEGFWILSLDEDVPLADGLRRLGAEGYELVGIQTASLRDNGGAGTSWYAPGSIYVFKRPLES